MRGYATAAVMAALVGTSGGRAQQPAMTVQQEFDAANAVTAGGDKTAALAAWTALEHRVGNNPRTMAVVRIRKSVTLFGLDRKDEAQAAARAGLAGLPASDPSLAEDRFEAQFLLGRIAQAALDYASAAEAYRAAETTATTPGNRLAAALAIAQVDTFVDPVAAQAALDRADALLAASRSEPAVRAAVALARGVLLLNEGRFAEARKQSQRAVDLYGGLTERTDLNDVAARSDTAIAAVLAGDPDTARQYMAYTGAGRLPEGTFNPAVEMTPPDCGGEAELKPADMAVVEFSVGDDGAVVEAAPVYAAGGGRVALEFARAAQRWSWTPEQVKALPRFFRYRARVEMRCSTGFTRPSVGLALRTALTTWLGEKDVTVPDPTSASAAAALPAERAALAKAGAGLSVVAASLPLLDNPVMPSDERQTVATRALAIADANHVPPLARLGLDLQARASAKSEGPRSRGYRDDLATMLAAPPYADDPRARSAIKLFLAESAGRRLDQQTRDELRQVADDPALAKTDSMKIAALLQIASIDQRDGDTAAAKAAFDRTGLTADQCALVDAPPKFLSAGGTFPQEAVRWGFEGWTLTQFDIAADGRVQDERAIISYPPFIFTKAGVQTMAGARYAATYRPGGGIGCGARTQRVKFLLPDRR